MVSRLCKHNVPYWFWWKYLSLPWHAKTYFFQFGYDKPYTGHFFRDLCIRALSSLKESLKTSHNLSALDSC